MPPKNENTVEEFAVEEAAPVAAPEVFAEEKKPYGQNPGDIVDACDAKGGRYQAVGAGKMRRLA